MTCATPRTGWRKLGRADSAGSLRDQHLGADHAGDHLRGLRDDFVETRAPSDAYLQPVSIDLGSCRFRNLIAQGLLDRRAVGTARPRVLVEYEHEAELRFLDPSGDGIDCSVQNNS